MSRKRPQPVSAVSRCIQRTVLQNPGIHFRGLGRAAHVTSAGQLRHHLDRLEHKGVLIEVDDGRYRRFFVAGAQDPKIRPAMARFTRVVPRRIAKLLLLGPMNRAQLRRSLGCADSTLGYHLSRMVAAGDLARERGPNSCVYSLASGETVRELLHLQHAAATTPADDDDLQPVLRRGAAMRPRPGLRPRTGPDMPAPARGLDLETPPPGRPDPDGGPPEPGPPGPPDPPGVPDPMPDFPGPGPGDGPDPAGPGLDR